MSTLTRALLGSPDFEAAQRAALGASLNELRIARGQIQMYWQTYESDIPRTRLDEQILKMLNDKIRNLRRGQ